jgi:hypothetical protein
MTPRGRTATWRVTVTLLRSATVSTDGIVKAARKPAGGATIALVPSWTREKMIPNASTTTAIEALRTAAVLCGT